MFLSSQSLIFPGLPKQSSLWETDGNKGARQKRGKGLRQTFLARSSVSCLQACVLLQSLSVSRETCS